MDKEAILISQTFVKDKMGQPIPQDLRTPILATDGSITRAEFDVAGRQSLNPEMVIKTQACNYNGEEIVEVDGTRYGVYRTYRPPYSDEVELYLERKTGV